MTKHLHFHVDRYGDAKALVEKYHYSHRMSANIQLIGTYHEQGGLFGDAGSCVAACVFSIPPTRWNIEVWELSRLVRTDYMNVQLTGLISKTVSFIKSLHKINVLVSFADWTQKHHGGIYQAASWFYGGIRERRMDGVMINNIFVPGRTCNSKYGTQSPRLLQEILPQCTIEPHYDEGKHLYWKPLNKKGLHAAKANGLLCLPYPKPNKEASLVGCGAGYEEER